MLKKIFFFLLYTVTFTAQELSDKERFLLAHPRTENSPVIPVILKFDDSKLNEVKFDKESGKSALQQFLEQGFTYADLKTPYATLVVLQAYKLSDFPKHLPDYLKDQPFYIKAYYPRQLGVPLEYAQRLHDALVTSDLLAAAVYREVMFRIRQKEMTIDVGPKYGFFRCGEFDICSRLSHDQIKKLLEANPD